MKSTFRAKAECVDRVAHPTTPLLLDVETEAQISLRDVFHLRKRVHMPQARSSQSLAVIYNGKSIQYKNYFHCGHGILLTFKISYILKAECEICVLFQSESIHLT